MRLCTPALALMGSLLCRTAAGEVSYPVATIAWEAPEGCPNELELVQQVEALLGEALQQAKPQGLRFVTHVQAEAGAEFRAVLRVSSGGEELSRELAHPSCPKLAEAVSLVIALAIDPDRVQQAQDQRGSAGMAPSSEGPLDGRGSPDSANPADTPRPTPSATAATTATAANSAAPANSAQPLGAGQSPGAPAAKLDGGGRRAPPNDTGNVGVGASLGGLVGAGVLPGSSFGAELGLGAILNGEWSLGAFAELWAPAEEPIPETSNGTLRMRQITLGTRGCWSPEVGGVAGLGCLAVEAAQLSGEGQDVEGARENVAVWAGVRGELGVLLPLSQVSALVVQGAGGISLVRPRFGLVAGDGSEVDVYEPSLWYLRAKVGALFRFD